MSTLSITRPRVALSVRSIAIIAVFFAVTSFAKADCIDQLFAGIDSCLSTYGDGIIGNICAAIQWIGAVGCIISFLFS